MKYDLAIERVREARSQISLECGHDPQVMLTYYRERQEQYRERQQASRQLEKRSTTKR